MFVNRDLFDDEDENPGVQQLQFQEVASKLFILIPSPTTMLPQAIRIITKNTSRKSNKPTQTTTSTTTFHKRTRAIKIMLRSFPTSLTPVRATPMRIKAKIKRNPKSTKRIPRRPPNRSSLITRTRIKLTWMTSYTAPTTIEKIRMTGTDL